jgi:hypothetical protein
MVEFVPITKNVISEKLFGHDITFSFYNSGACFGEIEVIHRKPRNYDVFCQSKIC